MSLPVNSDEEDFLQSFLLFPMESSTIWIYSFNYLQLFLHYYWLDLKEQFVIALFYL